MIVLYCGLCHSVSVFHWRQKKKLKKKYICSCECNLVRVVKKVERCKKCTIVCTRLGSHEGGVTYNWETGSTKPCWPLYWWQWLEIRWKLLTGFLGSPCPVLVTPQQSGTDDDCLLLFVSWWWHKLETGKARNSITGGSCTPSPITTHL